MTVRQQWSRCPADGRPTHPDDQKAIDDFGAFLKQSPADRLDYDAGVAMRAGDIDRAARLIYRARELDPARSALWDERDRRLRQAMAATTERRLADAGVRASDPGLAIARGWNAAVGAGPDLAEPHAGRDPPERDAKRQAATDLEAGQ